MRHFKYTIIAIVVVLILFAMKYWNDQTVVHKHNESSIVANQEICASLQKAFSTSTYTAWDYKSCTLVGNHSLRLELVDSTLDPKAQAMVFTDQNIDLKSANTYCELFYKPFPTLEKAELIILEKTGKNAGITFSTTQKICSKNALDYIEENKKPAETQTKQNEKATSDLQNNTVIQSTLDLDQVDVETVETTTTDLQQKAEELRTETAPEK